MSPNIHIYLVDNIHDREHIFNQLSRVYYHAQCLLKDCVIWWSSKVTTRENIFWGENVATNLVLSWISKKLPFKIRSFVWKNSTWLCKVATKQISKKHIKTRIEHVAVECSKFWFSILNFINTSWNQLTEQLRSGRFSHFMMT